MLVNIYLGAPKSMDGFRIRSLWFLQYRLLTNHLTAGISRNAILRLASEANGMEWWSFHRATVFRRLRRVVVLAKARCVGTVVRIELSCFEGILRPSFYFRVSPYPGRC